MSEGTASPRWFSADCARNRISAATSRSKRTDHERKRYLPPRPSKGLGDGVYEFVASDETIDRCNGIVRASGAEELGKEPPRPVRSRTTTLSARRSRRWMVPKLMGPDQTGRRGASTFIDTLGKFVDQIVRAVSVGFRPTTKPNYLRDE